MNNPTDKIIRLENIVKSFDGEQVLKNVSLEIGDREFVTLLGPSGCGKTTTLRIIGGFESPDEGTVYFDGKAVNDVPPYKRPVNTVFQKYALFPHLNVFENIAFGPKLKGASGPGLTDRVHEMLELVNLRGFEKRSISTLSGGQQQRVAIARALVGHPSVILADEPTGALDSKTGRDVLKILQELHKAGNTVVLITHDNSIAATAQRIIRLEDGRAVYDGPSDNPDAFVHSEFGMHAGDGAEEEEE